MSAASRRHRLRDRLMLAFSGFALLVALLYGFYVVLFVYLVEDAVFQGLLEDEAAAQLAHHAETGAWTTPALRFVTLHVDPATFPDALGARLTESPWRREFPGEAGRHYHLRVLEPAGSAAPTWLLAEVSQHLVVRPMRGGIAQWLGWSGLAVTLLALLLGAWLARRMTAPLSRLAALVEDAEPTHLPTRFAEEFPDDEVGTLARGLERLIERVEAFVEREREFTRDASHELRTPLTVIRVASDMIASDPATPPHQQRPLLRIRRATQDMEAVIDALLVLARERGVMPQSEIFSVVEVVEEELDKVRPLFEGKQLTLELDIQARPRLDAPPRVLGVMLGHLLRNAWAFTETGGVAVIVMSDRIIVRDSGIGMTADVLKRVYDPFFRADPFSQSGKGIGLSIVRRLGTRFGWPVALESTAGEGTTVTIVFRDRLV